MFQLPNGHAVLVEDLVFLVVLDDVVPDQSIVDYRGLDIFFLLLNLALAAEALLDM